MKYAGICVVVLMLLASAGIAATDNPPIASAGGRIVSIDGTAKTLVVKVDEGKGGSHDVAFVMADDSKIVKDTAAVTLDDLKAGDKVTVTYHAVEGRNVVVNIGVDAKS